MLHFVVEPTVLITRNIKNHSIFSHHTRALILGLNLIGRSPIGSDRLVIPGP